MATGTHKFPYPALSVAAGPVLNKLAAYGGLGTLGRALVVALGVGAIFALLSLIQGSGTRRVWVVIVGVALLAAIVSIATDALPP